MFSLDERLKNSTHHVASWSLSELLLSDNACYPWFILVPRVDGARELIDLSDAQQALLLLESNALSRWLMAEFNADKLNVATLGNVVPQLHLHHIARFEHDAAWPDPVWGKAEYRPYDLATIEALVSSLEQISSSFYA